MAFGKIKADTIAYTDTNQVEQDASVATLVDNANSISTNTTNIATNTTAIATKAPIASPTFTGTPAAPTATAGTNTTQIATTAFVTAAVPDISGKADLASPTFTGTPAAPTATAGDSSTQIATTAFVAGEVRTDTEIDTRADARIAADLAAATPTIQAYDADTAKTDVTQTFTAAQRGSIGVLTSGATVTPDFSAFNNFTLTLGENLTIANPTNLGVGQSGSIFLVQDATGSRSASWGSYWNFAGGTAPTLTTTADAVDRIDYIVRSSTSIHAVATLAYS